MRTSLFDEAVEGSINAALVAESLARIRSGRHPEIARRLQSNPRLEELLWFVQGMSMKPPGLQGLAIELIQHFPDRIGTSRLRECKNGQLPLEKRLQLWTEMANWARPPIINPQTGDPFIPGRGPAPYEKHFMRHWKYFPPKLVDGASKHMDKKYFLHAYRDVALAKLPEYLASLCLEAVAGYSIEDWYFNNIVGALLVYMNARATLINDAFPMTVVTKKVFDVVGTAHRTGLMIVLRGNSRYGKTASLEAYCNMWPGRARLVTVPESNSLWDFFHAIAEALGILNVGRSMNATRLRALIAGVLKHSHLMLIFDEGHFLIPRRYSHNSSPERLNWVRTQLYDRGHPVVISVTPQWFDGKNGDATKFEKVTNYAMQQFKGRWVSFSIPNELPDSDLIALIHHYLPEIQQEADCLEIASYAVISENFIDTIAIIGTLARDLAKRRSTTVSMELIRGIVKELFPDLNVKFQGTNKTLSEA